MLSLLDLTTTLVGWIVINEQVSSIVVDHPDRFVGLASVDPHREDAPRRSRPHSSGTWGYEALRCIRPNSASGQPTRAWSRYSSCVASMIVRWF